MAMTTSKNGLTPQFWLFLVVIAAMVLLGLPGCHYRHYREGNATYTSISLGTSQSVDAISVEAGKAGDPSYRKLEVRRVNSDPTPGTEVAGDALKIVPLVK